MISDKAVRIATRDGFVSEFWHDLNVRRVAGEDVTHQDVYEDLSRLYEGTFGRPQFSSFDAFRKYRDRH